MILYTLGTNYYKKQMKVYIVVTLITFVFSLIYESFSHEVYSIFMVFAFMIPWILGVLVSLLIYMKKLRARYKNV